MLRLSDREQALWALLLIKMWRSKARIPDDALYISRILGISKNEGLKFRATLQDLRLLVYDNADLVSPRLKKEYEIVQEVYTSAAIGGKRSAEARAEKYGTAQPNSNAPSNGGSNGT